MPFVLVVVLMLSILAAVGIAISAALGYLLSQWLGMTRFEGVLLCEICWVGVVIAFSCAARATNIDASDIPWSSPKTPRRRQKRQELS